MVNQGDAKYNPIMWINSAKGSLVFDRLESDPSGVIIANQDDFSMQQDKIGYRSILLYSQIKEGVYLFLETPREFIKQTADLAVRFTLYASLLTLLIALVLIAFISKKITKPILNMENVANKIANLDFNDHCRVESNDELGQLGTSINRMAETLQENIQRLTVMNAMLREDLAREEQTNKIRREFIANVSHDFKTPLSLITAYSESIRDQEQDREELNRQCDIILSESNKMDGLVNQLLKLSQLESKMITLQESMFDLTGSVEEMIYKYQILLKGKHLNLLFINREERIAFGDYAKIGQVLGNLIENAIKYTLEDGTIKIWITKEDKYIIHIYNESKEVSDIDPSQLFISFYKRDQSRSLEDKSYGLGLAIVKAIVELHGNQCGAYKEENGIVFWFEVQAYKEIDTRQDER
jgi:signal transduction histidine kinase